METIEKEVLEKIKSGKIAPRPRWVFSARNIAFWVAFAASVLVGSVAFGVILFMLHDHDWTVYANLHQTFLQYLLEGLPYFWIAWLVVFTGVSYLEFRNTTKGYRYVPYVVIFGSILVSMFFGTGFYLLGFGEKTHDLFTENMPYYHSLVFDKKGQWSQPDDGLLSGTVVNVEGPTQFVLRDWNGKTWQVTTAESGNMPLANAEELRIVGEEGNNGTFEAREVKPWRNDVPAPAATPPVNVMLTSSTTP